MSEYILQDDLYLGITPAGSYYAVQSQSEEPGRNFLHHLLRMPETPLFGLQVASDFSGLNKKHSLEFVHWLQDAGMIYGLEQAEQASQKPLEDVLPEILGSLSDSGKVVLAEQQGLYLGASGFPHEAAEELAAMSTELIAIYDRHKPLLSGNLRLRQRAWGLVDGTGSSEIGFWPIYIGKEVFTLVAEGMPQFNQANFKHLVWALSIRYDNR